MNKQIKILYALTTYNAYAYIDLSITLHKKFGNDVIVIDDGSCSEKLHDVCVRNNVPLLGICRQHNNKYGVGDVISTVQAISYAYFHGYTHVVKQSRRWVCLENPTPSLVELIKQSHGATFSNYTVSYGFGFRTQFCAYETGTWIQAIKKICKDLSTGKELGLVQRYIHVIAQQIEPKDELYKKYVKTHPVVNSQKGYVHWNWMGNDKKNPPSYILWHDKNRRMDYYNAAVREGLSYHQEDFDLKK